MKLLIIFSFLGLAAMAAERVEHSNQVIQHQNTTLTFDANSSLQDIDRAWTVSWDKLKDLADGRSTSTNEFVGTSYGMATNLQALNPRVRFLGTSSPQPTDTYGDIRFVGGNPVGFQDYLVLRNVQVSGKPWPSLLTTNMEPAMIQSPDSNLGAILTVTNADIRYGVPSAVAKAALTNTTADAIVSSLGAATGASVSNLVASLSTGYPVYSNPRDPIELGGANAIGQPNYSPYNNASVHTYGAQVEITSDVTFNRITVPAWGSGGTPSLMIQTGSTTNLYYTSRTTLLAMPITPSATGPTVVDLPESITIVSGKTLYAFIVDSGGGTYYCTRWTADSATAPYRYKTIYGSNTATNTSPDLSFGTGLTLGGSIQLGMKPASTEVGDLTALTNDLATAQAHIASLYGTNLAISLPATYWGIFGNPMRIYWDGAVARGADWIWSTYSPDNATGVQVGTNLTDSWFWTPGTNYGTHSLTIVATGRGPLFDITNATKTVSTVTCTNVLNATKALLYIGDSTGAGTCSALSNIVSTVTTLTLNQLGTIASGGGLSESIPGIKASIFTTAGTYGGYTNEFWNGAEFDANYWRTNKSLGTPTHIVINLGINDVATATVFSTAWSTMYAALDTMIGSLTNTFSSAKVGICLCYPGSSDNDGFGANYGASELSQKFARNNLRQLYPAMIARYGGRTAEKLYVVPTHTSIDTVYGYPYSLVAPIPGDTTSTILRHTNGVHPNSNGYRQAAHTILAWIVNNP